MTTARNYWVIWWYCWLVEMMPQLLVKLGNMMCLSALPLLSNMMTVSQLSLRKQSYPCLLDIDSQSCNYYGALGGSRDTASLAQKAKQLISFIAVRYVLESMIQCGSGLTV